MDGETEKNFSSHQYLAGKDKETQKEEMQDWFYGHYEDPVNNCPYETAEGGYQWIWGDHMMHKRF